MAFLLLIFLTVINFPSVSSLALQAESPEQVEAEEEFSVSISADTSETHDVKIFVHKSSSDKISRDDYVSQIYDSQKEIWSDSWYYLAESFPANTEYKIKIFGGEEGQMAICIRLRPSSDKDASFEQLCNPIEVLDSSSKEEEEEEKDEKSEEKINPIQTKAPSAQKEEPLFARHFSNLSSSQGRITLSPQNKTPSNSLLTAEGKKRNFMIYGFVGFCILMIILLSLRKL